MLLFRIHGLRSSLGLLLGLFMFRERSAEFVMTIGKRDEIQVRNIRGEERRNNAWAPW